MDTVLSNKHFEYTGKIQPKQGTRDKRGHPLYPYYPSDALAEAVNLAIFLQRPLLLKGEPGCGKTRLAQAVAYELGLPYQSWSVKSTSKARDGLYTYDTVGRLRRAQLAAVMKNAQHTDDPAEYVTFGPLGHAIKNDKRTVVLIDEIDKADIDFPNDLLLELDEKRFEIEETGQKFEAKEGAEPIIFITSNDEKDLPDAFLRRCLFHYIEFPDRARLVEIVNAHISDVPETLVYAALDRFIKLRMDMREKGEAGKKVSTSELIDWVRVLRRYPEDKVLKQLNGKLPFAGVLLKSWDDHQRFISQIGLRTSL
jgi:MoxR-like ATPase